MLSYIPVFKCFTKHPGEVFPFVLKRIFVQVYIKTILKASGTSAFVYRTYNISKSFRERRVHSLCEFYEFKRNVFKRNYTSSAECIFLFCKIAPQCFLKFSLAWQMGFIPLLGASSVPLQIIFDDIIPR